MQMLKERVQDVCAEVVKKFPDWKFVSGKFKNSLLKHTDLIIDPGFSFDRGFVHLQPCVVVKNKRAESLTKRLTDEAIPVSTVSFQTIAHLLKFMPEQLRLSCLICENKSTYLAEIRKANRFDGNAMKTIEERSLDFGDMSVVLEAMMKDGISFFDDYYDLTDEEHLLKALPPPYTTRNGIIYDEMEREEGVVMCVVHMMYGDFDFVERYCSEEFKTVYPKRTSELERILVALPNLRRRYDEDGSLV
ncbi:hypothetical protein C0Z18_24935 [Trinickia dabaoshanensis]|uniref:Uncharacterized protein n=2 Tax=Trinickia dabaoshanensis TaxID=564714 RepID=A0A2N7VFP4_9BURK|nr:hypothetical protein C0Z18_24935 [Trinickia dabaoshanensis]